MDKVEIIIRAEGHYSTWIAVLFVLSLIGAAIAVSRFIRSWGVESLNFSSSLTELPPPRKVRRPGPKRTGQ